MTTTVFSDAGSETSPLLAAATRRARGFKYLRYATAGLIVVFLAAYVVLYFVISPMGAVRIYKDMTVRGLAYVHVASGSLWLIASTLQLFPGFRTASFARHRSVGYVAIGACGVSFIAVWAMFFVAGPSLEGGLGILLSSVVFSLVWVHSLYQGVRAIQRGQVELHRYYMLRAYGIAGAIIAMRPGLILLQSFFSTQTEDDTRLRLGIVSWAVWALAYMAIEAYATTSASFASRSRTSFEPCTVVSRKLVSPDMALLILESPTHHVLAHATPGHHAALRIAGATRSYTPVPLGLVAKDMQCPHRIGLLVKKVPNGKVSTLLHDCAIGSSVDVLLPVPSCITLMPETHAELVLVAGGSGFSTMLSLLQSAIDDLRYKTIHLFVYTTAGTPFKDELDALASPLRIVTHFSNDRPTAFDFRAVDPSRAIVAVCGPLGFMELVMASFPATPRVNVHAFGLDDR
ncbi:hypothetical protein SPRG_15316 [Saprolegnia parasitica CBS 223.65]|uniref:FAD-binding FR-type domain-containing protein n=1 Tax=Saprolegnia parasitica (strain CBS 223.65) TaxID=695850 RepID=A0A067BV32_SAPPC|nr:hypothetical protein SPRG_15316 [Saprolegnia parasitica CBS 223.65]KDO18487.1 hypothetical protein SPRG_15316 [Saprolegnia parasitica CBS 223.65]|eukprot:XP_012210806.1 hypothetical protein SPRG_15316 [Saprolegnia parasitica CBS 223.65]